VGGRSSSACLRRQVAWKRARRRRPSFSTPNGIGISHRILIGLLLLVYRLPVITSQFTNVTTRMYVFRLADRVSQGLDLLQHPCPPAAHVGTKTT